MKEEEIRPQDLFNRYLEISRQDIERFFTEKRTFTPVNCPACDSQRHSFGLEKHGFTYVICDDCGSLYLSPRPSAELLDQYYIQAESVKFWSSHFYKQTAEARRAKMFRPRAEYIQNLVGNISPGQLDFVDVGSGFGVFLEEIERLGIFRKVAGVEPNPELAEICRGKGFQVYQKPVEKISPGEVQVDFATCFEVLEHVYDPLDFLIAIRHLLKPGGKLVFTTLTVSGFDIQILWEHSKSVYPPHHINLLSVYGMRRLVERAGFRLVDLSTPGQLDIDIVANMVKENPLLPLPRFVDYLIKLCDENARQEFQRFLSANRLSSHVRVIASREVI